MGSLIIHFVDCGLVLAPVQLQGQRADRLRFAQSVRHSFLGGKNGLFGRKKLDRVFDLVHGRRGVVFTVAVAAAAALTGWLVLVARHHAREQRKVRHLLPLFK